MTALVDEKALEKACKTYQEFDPPAFVPSMRAAISTYMSALPKSKMVKEKPDDKAIKEAFETGKQCGAIKGEVAVEYLEVCRYEKEKLELAYKQLLGAKPAPNLAVLESVRESLRGYVEDDVNDIILSEDARKGRIILALEALTKLDELMKEGEG